MSLSVLATYFLTRGQSHILAHRSSHDYVTIYAQPSRYSHLQLRGRCFTPPQELERFEDLKARSRKIPRVTYAGIARGEE